MKNIEIKEMTKDQRLTHITMLVNSYKTMMIYDIASDDEIREEMSRKDFKTALRIALNMYRMRGFSDNFYLILRV